ncbi:MAG TPA: two-component regulator propeller domain-containing protein, partial [Chitinophagaceae bacterium]
MKLIAIAFFFIAVPAIGQEPVYSHHKWFKVENGLPQSFVSALAQDKDGFLWIGTRDGLARYDGREFRVFRSSPHDSTSLAANVIIDLFLDNQNLLWIFYINEKVDCCDPRRMQVCYKDSFSVVKRLLVDLKNKKFSRDQKGKFWFNSSYKGIVSYDPLQNKTTWFDSLHRNLHSNNNLGVVEDPHGKIYAFTDKGIEILNSETNASSGFVAFSAGLDFKFIHGAFNQSIALPDGRVVLSETNRLIVFDPVSKNFAACRLPDKIPAAPNAIQHLKLGRDGLLYVVAVGGGVYRFEKNNRFTWLWQSKSDNPFANDARSFLIDQSMVMWFGTNAAGMYKIDLMAVPFNSYAYNINFVSDVLTKFTDSTIQVPATLQDGKWAYGLRSCYDRSHTLWLTQKRNETDISSLAVYKLSGNKLQLLPSPANVFPVIRGLSTDISGIMYGVDLRGNIWKWENETAPPSVIPSVLHLPPTVTITDMVADDGVFWITTDKKGLYKIDKSRIIEQYTTENDKKNRSWPTNQLTSLCKDPLNKDVLWIGTLGYGLIRFEKSSSAVRTFTINDNLPNNTVYSIVPDKEGNLWISTNNGISRFSKNRNQFYNFDVRDGLISNEFNRFHHLLLPDGRMAFGGPEGYSIFDPGSFMIDSFSTKIAITNLLINNQSIGNTIRKNGITTAIGELKQLILPYNKNFLQFEFAGLQFNEPEKIRYR